MRNTEPYLTRDDDIALKLWNVLGAGTALLCMTVIALQLSA